MRANEIVISEMESNGSIEVFPLLTESIGQPCQAAHVQSSRAVESFDMTCRNEIRIGTANDFHLLHRSNFWRTVAAFLMMLAFVYSVGLDNHSKINVHAESV